MNAAQNSATFSKELESQGTLARAKLLYLDSLHLDQTSIGRSENPK